MALRMKGIWASDLSFVAEDELNDLGREKHHSGKMTSLSKE
jgi:hypothetical protein